MVCSQSAGMLSRDWYRIFDVDIVDVNAMLSLVFFRVNLL